jgi:hypothetical protein
MAAPDVPLHRDAFLWQALEGIEAGLGIVVERFGDAGDDVTPDERNLRGLASAAWPVVVAVKDELDRQYMAEVTGG